MNKQTYLMLSLLLPSIIFAQASQENLELFNTLPDDVRQQILNERNLNNLESVPIEDNLELNDFSDQESDDGSEIFGLDFFDFEVTTSTPLLDIPLPADYILSVNDELEILLIGNENKLHEVRIDLSGNVLIPEVGSVSLVGLTLSNANEKIQEIISRTFIGTKTSLSVSKPSARKISVIGAVNKPGSYLMNPYVTISESIKYANGLTQKSSLREIKVISLNGDETIVDFYDFLILGDRAIDLNLKNGDTVIIGSTDRHIEIAGAIARPMKYEYLSSDSFQDLISFSQGFTKYANPQSLFVNSFDKGSVTTKEVNKINNIDDQILLKLFVGSYEELVTEQLFLRGGKVRDGYLEYQQGQMLSDIISTIKTSDSTYDYFQVLKQYDNSGKKVEIIPFSLKDPKTYEKISLKKNPIITFFTLDDILADNYVEPIARKYLKQLRIGDEDFQIPLVGIFNPLELLNLLNTSYAKEDILLDKSYYVSLDSNIYLVEESNVSADGVTALSFSVEVDPEVIITVLGQVKNPGIYRINSNLVLSDVYALAGGLKDDAYLDGIQLYREGIRSSQLKVAEVAQQTIISNAAAKVISTQLTNNNSNFGDLKDLLSLASNESIDGRITGDLSPSSNYSQNLVLEDGDRIFVPVTPNTISIFGEVNNPVTIKYEKEITINDYIKIAGGYTSLADKRNIYVLKGSGEMVVFQKGMFAKKIFLEAGDTIIINQNINKVDGLSLASLITTILSNTAVSIAALQTISD